MNRSVKRALLLAGLWMAVCAVAYTAAILKARSGELEALEQAGLLATLPAMPWFLMYQTDPPTWGLWCGYVVNAGLVIMLDSRMRYRRNQREKARASGRRSNLGGFAMIRPKFPDWDDD